MCVGVSVTVAVAVASERKAALADGRVGQREGGDGVEAEGA